MCVPTALTVIEISEAEASPQSQDIPSLSHLIASYTHLHPKLSLLLLDSSFSCKEEKHMSKS